MNLNHLRTFAVIARAGNVTRAARRLNISQPAVSKQLGELEQDLGVSLFDRLPRGMRLTAAGEVLQTHAQRILAAEQAAHTELHELSTLGRGRLAIGASTTIGGYLVPSLFGAFRRAHPAVELSLDIANTAVVQSAVLRDQLDLGLTEGFVSSDQLEVEVVAHDEMVAIAAAGHPAARAGALQARDLLALPFIMREPGSGTRDVIEAALARKGLRIAPIMSLGSTEAVKNAVASGLGVALVSRLTAALELNAGRLAELKLADLRIRRPLHLIRLSGKQPSPAVRAFIDLLRGRPEQDRTWDAYAI